ncbi:hypothetical protein KJ591_00160 [Patescibacteria group bacterium]|nr:hypothetical protein [Patescibacteria group bacterium]MBU4022771.1 hypothetical protein [Patescibacteria group bacterium]MBU4162135.1 hypothetical protein [Patescibacteria group bacterium]
MPRSLEKPQYEGVSSRDDGKPELTMTKEELGEHEQKEADKELKGIREKIDKMTDKLGMPIDEGIKEAVVMFNAFDIKTTQSCEGHLEEGARLTPGIMVQPETPEIEDWYDNEEIRERVTAQSMAMKGQLIDLLNLFYRERKSDFEDMLGFRGVGYGFEIESNGAEVFKGLNEEKAQEKLIAYRKEMQDFTDFLKRIYPKHLFKKPLR